MSTSWIAQPLSLTHRVQMRHLRIGVTTYVVSTLIPGVWMQTFVEMIPSNNLVVRVVHVLLAA